MGGPPGPLAEGHSMRLWQRIRRRPRVPIGSRVRAVHLGQYCAGGLGFGAGAPGTAPGWEPAASRRARSRR